MDTIQQRDASSAVAAVATPTVRLRMLSDQLVGTEHRVAGEVVEVPAGRLAARLQAAGLAEPCDDGAMLADPGATTVDVAGPAASADDPPPAEDAAAKARKAVEAARAKAAARGSK